MGVARGRGGEAIRRVQTEAARQPEPVKRWLQQISANSRSVTMGGARARLNDEWQSTVVPMCRKALKGRYPFYPGSSVEMTLADFGKLLAPGGLIDGFFNDNLKSFVNTSRGRWRWKKVGGASLGIPDSVLRQFERAREIRDTFFQGGGQTPSLSFGLKPVYLDANVQTFMLDLDGQIFRYRHGPTRILPAQWPSADSTGQVRIIFEDDSGARLTRSKEGPWAWFHILDQAEVVSKTRDKLNVNFDVSGRKATWEISATSVINAYLVKELQKFRCPERL